MKYFLNSAKFLRFVLILNEKNVIMQFEKIHNKGQAQLFRNQYLEYLTKTHPLVIWGMYLPVIIYLPYFAITRFDFSIFQTILIFLGGIFFWTFFEYLMHRFVFHWVSNSPRAQRIVYVMHGNHHEFPRDRAEIIYATCSEPDYFFDIIFTILFNYEENVFIFFPGFLLGYLIYGSMHYAIHAWHPPFKWMKPIWRNHHLHHYKSDDKGFGVSTHFWDKIFKTDFDLKKEKEDEEA